MEELKMALNMAYNNLVLEEKILTHVIEVTGCITYSQAIMILNEYLGFTEARSEVAILRMVDLKKMFFSEDKRFLLRGNVRSAYKGNLDREMIETLYIALEYITSPEELMYLYGFNGINELHFIAGNENHVVVHCGNALQKVIYWSEKYKNKREKLMARAKTFTQDELYSIYGKIIFVFSHTVDEEKMVGRIQDLELDIPYDLIFLKESNLIIRPEYEIYEA